MVGKPSLFCEDLGRQIHDPFLLAISRGQFCEPRFVKNSRTVKRRPNIVTSVPIWSAKSKKIQNNLACFSFTHSICMILVHLLFLCIAIYIYVACAVFHVLLLYVYIAYQHNQCMFSFIFTLHNCFCIPSVFFCGM